MQQTWLPCKQQPTRCAPTLQLELFYTVIQTEKGGAVLGAAVAGVSAYFKHIGEKFNVEDYSAAIMPGNKVVRPTPEDLTAFHCPGGYLEKFAIEEARLIAKHPPYQ